MDSATATIDAAEALLSRNSYREAETLFEHCVVAGSKPAFACSRLAAIAGREGRVEDALRWIREALALDPDNADYHYTLGALHKAAQDPVQAEQAYREAVRLNPDHCNGWVSLGILLRTLRRMEEAETAQREALRIDPDSFMATLNLGNVLYSQKRLQEAVACFRQAIAFNSASAEAHNNLGRALLDLNDPRAATLCFRNALALKPDYFDAAEGLGWSLYNTCEYASAIAAAAEALRLNPQNMKTRALLFDVYCAVGKVDAACALYEELLAKSSETTSAKCALAVGLSLRGHYTKPRTLFEQALADRPDDTWIQFNYSLFLLRNREFERAWRFYEVREYRGHYPIKGGIGAPKWQGEPLAGKTLLLTSEQGLGDEIMFASLYPEILGEAGHCILECSPKVAPVMKQSFPQATIVAFDVKQPDWQAAYDEYAACRRPVDYWSPAGSLPLYRRTSLEQFPQHKGYMRADSNRTQHWRQRLQEIGPGLKVGISWRGGAPQTRAPVRSLSLEQLRPLLSTAGIHVVNLQYGECTGEIEAFSAATGIPVHHWPEAIADYGETAALVSGLDLVISVCTAVIHLGGALGKQVWVMVPSIAEWRYGHEGTTMVWYPSVCLFRQPKPDAWGSVVAEVRRALVKLLQAGPGAKRVGATFHQEAV